MQFQECFIWFYEAYGKYDEHDIADNETKMKKPWSTDSLFLSTRCNQKHN